MVTGPFAPLQMNSQPVSPGCFAPLQVCPQVKVVSPSNTYQFALLNYLTTNVVVIVFNYIFHKGKMFLRFFPKTVTGAMCVSCGKIRKIYTGILPLFIKCPRSYDFVFNVRAS